MWKNKVFAFFNYGTVRRPVRNLQGNGWYDTAALAALAPAGSIASKYLSFPGTGVVGTLNTAATCATAGLTEAVNCRTLPGQSFNLGTPRTKALGTQDHGSTNSEKPGR